MARKTTLRLHWKL